MRYRRLVSLPGMIRRRARLERIAESHDREPAADVLRQLERAR